MKVLLICCAFCVGGLVAYVLIENWRFDQHQLTRALYELTPLGTSYSDALARVAKRFPSAQENEHVGFYRQDRTPATVVGVKSIHVLVGRYYQFPIGTTYVEAYWGFDSRGKLIDIWVLKTTDSL
jgi:hypothetical protein